MAKTRFWSGFHWPSLFLMLGLCTAGILIIYSATHGSEMADLKNASIQQAACMVCQLFVSLHGWCRHAPRLHA